MKILKKIIIFLIIIFIGIWTILLFKQYFFLKKGKYYEKKHKWIKAVDNFIFVLYLHTPYSPFEKKSIIQIKYLLKIFKEKNMDKHLLYTMERLRSTIYGIRAFNTPYKKLLKKIEIEIAKLKTEKLLKDGYKKNFADTYNELFKIMKKDLAPKSYIAFFSIILFLLYILSIFMILLKKIEIEKINYNVIFKYLSISLIILILHFVLLYLA